MSLDFSLSEPNRGKADERQARKRNASPKTEELALIRKAKVAGRQARKANCVRKTEEQLMRDNGYTPEQARAYLEAYDAVIPDNQEKLKINQAKHAGQVARKHNYARKTEAQLMSGNGYTPEQAKAYLEAYDAVIPNNQEKLQINKAKKVARKARKRNTARKTEAQLMSDYGYTPEQAKAYLEAYDAAIPDSQEKLQINQAKHAGRQARKKNTARKTEEQLMRENGYSPEQAKAYLEAYDAAIPDSQEKLQINQAKHAGRQARKKNTARKTEEQLMRENGYSPEQAKTYLQAYDAVDVDEEQSQIRKAKAAGWQARKANCAQKTEEQLMRDDGYTPEQAKAYLEAYDAAIPDNQEKLKINHAKHAGQTARKRNTPRKTEAQLMSDYGYTPEQAKAYLKGYDSANAYTQEKLEINNAKYAGRQARKANCARKTEEQLMRDNGYTPEQAKAYLEAFDSATCYSEEKKKLYKAKDAGRRAGKRNSPRKTEEQLMRDNVYTPEQAKAYLQAYDAAVATIGEQTQIKDANPLKRKGVKSAEALAKRHAKNVSAQGESETPLSTNTASSQCELPPENSIDILIEAIFENEKTQNMRPYYSAVSRRDTESSVDKTLVNADAENASAKVRQKL